MAEIPAAVALGPRIDMRAVGTQMANVAAVEALCPAGIGLLFRLLGSVARAVSCAFARRRRVWAITGLVFQVAAHPAAGALLLGATFLGRAGLEGGSLVRHVRSAAAGKSLDERDKPKKSENFRMLSPEGFSLHPSCTALAMLIVVARPTGANDGKE